jgi:drug/metabolite transporter (DMT)-like permease
MFYITVSSKIINMKKEMILLIFCGIVYGAAAPAAQFLLNLGLSSYEIAVTTTMFPTILFLILSASKKEIIQRKDIKFFLLIGFLNSVLELTWLGSISLGTPVSIFTLLLYTQPLWTIIFGRIFFKEKITRLKISSLIIVLVGVLILVSPWDIKTNLNLTGIILAGLSGLLYSLFLIVSKEATNRKFHYTKYMFGFSIFTIFWLLTMQPFYKIMIKNDVLTRLDVNVISNKLFETILGSIIIKIIPVVLLYKGISKIKISTAGIVLLIEPVIATIIAYFLFNQPITQSVIIGGFLIIFSNYLIIRKNES